jgi:hypothetical protein
MAIQSEEVPAMWRKVLGILRREEGGISTYVAQAVMVLAVLGVAILIISTTNELGEFVVSRIQDFMDMAP